jgi:hypothetical protein
MSFSHPAHPHIDFFVRLNPLLRKVNVAHVLDHLSWLLYLARYWQRHTLRGQVAYIERGGLGRMEGEEEEDYALDEDGDDLESLGGYVPAGVRHGGSGSGGGGGGGGGGGVSSSEAQAAFQQQEAHFARQRGGRGGQQQQQQQQQPPYKPPGVGDPGPPDSPEGLQLLELLLAPALTRMLSYEHGLSMSDESIAWLRAEFPKVEEALATHREVTGRSDTPRLRQLLHGPGTGDLWTMLDLAGKSTLGGWREKR